MRTWHTLEAGYERVRFLVGLAILLVLLGVGVAAVSFLVWLWRIVR